MAVELATAYVSIAPSTRGLGRSLTRELSGPLETEGGLAGERASRRFGTTFAAGLASAAKKGATALGLGLGVAGAAGLKVAADFQQTTIAFEGILGSGEKAAAFLQELRDFAARTPFQFTGLAQSAQQLLAVGFAAEDVLPVMTDLGNVAATLGVGEAEIKGVVRALGQMRGKGKASAEELQQISEQVPGFSAINAIAKDMGITTAEAFKRLEKGAIPADQAIESILNGMRTFPGAAGAMDRQSKTLNGVLSTFKDTLAGIAIDFITPALPAISSAIQTFATNVGTFMTTLRTGLTGDDATRIETVALGFRTAFVSVRDFLRDDLIPVLSDLVEDGFNAISDWWDEHGDAVKSLVSDVFGTLQAAAEALLPVIRDDLAPAVVGFGTWLIEDGPGVQLAIGGIAAAMTAYAVSAAAAAAATLLTIAPFLLLGLAVVGLAWASNLLWEKLSLGPKISGVLQWVIDHVLEPFLDTVNDLIESLRDLYDLLNRLPDVPHLPGGGGLIPGLNVPLLPWADDGGVMPGPRGVHSLAWVAGGETILPTHKTDLPDALGAMAGGTHLHVTALPGDDVIDRGMRELRWHRQIQLAVSSR